MNIYLVSQSENIEYDTYDSMIVVAENEENARNINPNNGQVMTNEDWNYKYSSWASSAKYVNVLLIGKASDLIPKGIILKSFNAG